MGCLFRLLFTIMFFFGTSFIGMFLGKLLHLDQHNDYASTYILVGMMLVPGFISPFYGWWLSGKILQYSERRDASIYAARAQNRAELQQDREERDQHIRAARQHQEQVRKAALTPEQRRQEDQGRLAWQIAKGVVKIGFKFYKIHHRD